MENLKDKIEANRIERQRLVNEIGKVRKQEENLKTSTLIMVIAIIIFIGVLSDLGII